MVREIPCNAWALGFSGAHHIKHVVGGSSLGRISGRSGPRGFHCTCQYFKGSEGLAHSSLLWRFLPGHVSLLKSSSHSHFIFYFFVCVFWTSFIFFSATPLPILNPSFSTWLELSAFSSTPGSPGGSEDQGSVFCWMCPNHSGCVPLSQRC